MNRVRNLLVTAALLAFVPFAAFAQTDVDLTMSSADDLTVGAFTLTDVPAAGAVDAFSSVADFATVTLDYSTNSVASGSASKITAAATAWNTPVGATVMPVLMAAASAPEGTGAGTTAGQVILITGGNVVATEILVSGITNGANHTSTVTFAINAENVAILAGAYDTTVTFTLTAPAGL